MSSTNISAPAPADDTGFLAQLLPNRGRVTFLRGLVRTRSTSSPYAVYDWLSHGYQRNSHVQILHDPNGPDVKIAGESAWLVYSWDKIFLILGWLVFFLTLHTIVQRRLEYLETLREDYDAFPSRSSPQPGPDDLTDLNLP